MKPLFYQPIACVVWSVAVFSDKSVGELARTLLSFKRPLGTIELQQCRKPPIMRSFHLGGRVTPSASSPRVL